MDMKELKLEQLEKIIGGDMNFAYATIPSSDVTTIIDAAWRLKVYKHYTKEQATDEICEGYRPVQRQEVTDLISQYWDRM